MIYLDHQATTPVEKSVLDAMLPYFCEHYGNPSSTSHPVGWQARMGVEKARNQVASCIGAKNSEIYFTSGATEANNMAVFGLLKSLDKNKRWHIVTSSVEHPAILEAFSEAANCFNVETELLPVNQYGQVEPETFEKAIKENTVLASFIAASNEVGTINPIKKLGEIAKKNQVLFHTDATQAIGKFAVDVDDMGIDMLSLSGHKIYGPKGVGALYVRSLSPNVHLKPMIVGGGQEEGMRSGTLNVPGIVGLGAACELCEKQLEADNTHYETLAKAFLEILEDNQCRFVLNGHPLERIKNNLHLSFPNCDMSASTANLGQIACSAGSACASSKAKPSHVLTAMGVNTDDVRCSLRVGFGRHNTLEQVKSAAQKIGQHYAGKMKQPS